MITEDIEITAPKRAAARQGKRHGRALYKYNGLIARAHELSPRTSMKAKVPATKVTWTIDVAKTIAAVTGLLGMLHLIGWV